MRAREETEAQLQQTQTEAGPHSQRGTAAHARAHGPNSIQSLDPHWCSCQVVRQMWTDAMAWPLVLVASALQGTAVRQAQQPSHVPRATEQPTAQTAGTDARGGAACGQPPPLSLALLPPCPLPPPPCPAPHEQPQHRECRAPDRGERRRITGEEEQGERGEGRGSAENRVEGGRSTSFTRSRGRIQCLYD